MIDLVYRVQTHFAAQEVRVISAYRTPHGRNASNHGRGRAIDLVVPGAADADVAEFARELGFVGVGVYPTSGFVHIDVRDRSYFWVDASAPGRRNRERSILRDLALKSDEAAAVRGELRLAPFSIGTDVDAAIRDRKSGGERRPPARTTTTTAPTSEPASNGRAGRADEWMTTLRGWHERSGSSKPRSSPPAGATREPRVSCSNGPARGGARPSKRRSRGTTRGR